MNLESSFVLDSLQDELVRESHGKSLHYSSVITDSRKIMPGCLFVAIKGEKFDGHDYIQAAISAGAGGIVSSKDFSTTASVNAYLVRDTEIAYRKIAAAWRRQFSIPIIAVAGSVGKTTTKELLSAVLGGKFKKVLKTQGSQNGFLGIPMTLLELRPEHDVAVVEIGIDEIGAMEKHLSIVEPSLTLLTAIAPEHLEKLKDLETVAREECIALSKAIESNKTVVFNLDDNLIRKTVPKNNYPKAYFFSLEGKTAPHAISDSNYLEGKLSEDSAHLIVSGRSMKRHTFSLPLLGEHNAHNLLGAITAATALGLTAEEIEKGLVGFKNAGGRSEVVNMRDGTTVLCDYYNASPASSEAGFELLNRLALNKGTKIEKWACLGDMLELGELEEKLHRDLSLKLQVLRFDHILLYGERMKYLEDELQKRKFRGNVRHFKTHGEMAAFLAETAPSGCAILIKGSRGMKMEEVWKAFQLIRGSG